jgi:hypothetical protein
MTMRLASRDTISPARIKHQWQPLTAVMPHGCIAQR